MMNRKYSLRAVLGLASAVTLGVLLAACSAAQASGGSTGPATASSAATQVVQQLQFPNKDLYVQLNGYDSTLNMVEFQLVFWVPGGPDDGHYIVDPANSGAHRLPLAANATITALSPLCTGPSTGNPNVDGSACTKAQFIAALQGTAEIAKVHADATDHISTVQELYHP